MSLESARELSAAVDQVLVESLRPAFRRQIDVALRWGATPAQILQRARKAGPTPLLCARIEAYLVAKTGKEIVSLECRFDAHTCCRGQCACRCHSEVVDLASLPGWADLPR